MNAVSEPERIETVVVGGGQAGLSVGYHLARRGLQLCHPRRQRADRRRLAEAVGLAPALHAGTLQRARRHAVSGPADIHSRPRMRWRTTSSRTRPASLFRCAPESGCGAYPAAATRFLLDAGDRRFEADNVVVAMGSYQLPRSPAFAASLDPDIVQLHSSAYRNVAQLREGRVLVVGVGNSGAEIALDVAVAHPTWLAGNESGRVPFRPESALARHVFLPLMFRVIGHRVLTVRTPVGRKMRPKLLAHAAPVVRVKPADLAAAGIERVSRVVGTRDGLPVLDDERVLPVENVIWCTGFDPDFSWIDLPVFGTAERPNEPIHVRGIVADQPGLYFVGLYFLYAMSSGFLPGVGRDAEHVVKHIASRKQRTSDSAGKRTLRQRTSHNRVTNEAFPASRSLKRRSGMVRGQAPHPGSR